MNDDIKDMWKYYYNKAGMWLEEMTPAMWNVAIKLGLDIYPGEEILTVTQKFEVPTGKYDLTKITQYLDNPEKCVDYPSAAHMVRQMGVTDAPWIKDVTKNRKGNHQELNTLLDESVNELNHPTTC